MNNNEDIYLSSALSEAGLAVLPKPLADNATTIWLKAICRVRSVNGSCGYCIAENGGDRGILLKRYFGPLFAIKGIESIHPYKNLERRFTPVLRTDDAMLKYLVKSDVPEAKVKALLSKEGKSIEQMREDRKTLKKMVMDIAVRDALEMLAEDERCRKINEYGKGNQG